jgi:regulator of ribonuclease activity A
VRDSAELAACEVGVKALGTIPVRSIKRGGGLQDAVVQIDGVRVAPGEWLYADEDGVIVSSQPLHS